MKKLGLNMNDATKFARYLVEEREEKSESNQAEDKDEMITYDPSRKVTGPTLSVRLMVNSTIGFVYTAKHE